MNERLLHLWWHLIYIHIPNISINYCLKAINTRSLYKEKRANDAHNPKEWFIKDACRPIPSLPHMCNYELNAFSFSLLHSTNGGGTQRKTSLQLTITTIIDPSVGMSSLFFHNRGENNLHRTYGRRYVLFVSFSERFEVSDIKNDGDMLMRI